MHESLYKIWWQSIKWVWRYFSGYVKIHQSAREALVSSVNVYHCSKKKANKIEWVDPHTADNWPKIIKEMH